MANRKEIKSLDLTSLTTVGIGIHAIISIVIALLVIIIFLIVGGVNGFLANLIIVPFIIFGTILSTIIFLFGRGLIYNILVKKINCISFEIEEGEITKVDTKSVSVILAIIELISFIIIYVMFLGIVPFTGSALIQILMLTGQMGIALLVYNIISLLYSPVVILILLLAVFLITLIEVFIGAAIYNILTPYIGGIKAEIKAGREYSTVESVNAKSAAIMMAVISLVLGAVMSLIMIILNTQLAFYALTNILSSFIGGFISTLIIVFLYNKISDKIGKLKLELE